MSKTYHNTPSKATHFFLFQHDRSLKSYHPDDQTPSKYNHPLLPIFSQGGGGSNIFISYSLAIHSTGLVKGKLTIPPLLTLAKFQDSSRVSRWFDAIREIIEGSREILETKLDTFES